MSGAKAPLEPAATGSAPVTNFGQREIGGTGLKIKLLGFGRWRLPFLAGNGNPGNTNANSTNRR